MAAVCAPPASGGASAAAHEAIAIEIAAMRSTTQSKLADNAVLLAVADGAVAAAQKEAREFEAAVLHGHEGAQVGGEQTLFHVDATSHAKEQLAQRMVTRSRRLNADLVRMERKLELSKAEQERGKALSARVLEVLRLELRQLPTAVEAVSRAAGHLKASNAREDARLDQLRRELAAAEAYGAQLAKSLVQAAQQLARKEEDTQRAASETAQAQRQLKALQASLLASPPVAATDYIKVKSDVALLEKNLASAQRKLQVAQLVRRGRCSAATPPKSARKGEAASGERLLKGILDTRKMAVTPR